MATASTRPNDLCRLITAERDGVPRGAISSSRKPKGDLREQRHADQPVQRDGDGVVARRFFTHGLLPSEILNWDR